ncbi:HLH transcription factor, putative [Metarhizium acridum CQMa 102]|uniref:HLH transcription factor, putative n=1 Tax=Metarhizium acridum (strain CQMa 102) TaxID=655827 RepID=E9E607_METAQ|nr:HLH transcription factor, putative [Metarhizium acridum CQMa 102]EFY88687.1 HLH transcription factor, putative [Metarhizium acridum CQMa 102]
MPRPALPPTPGSSTDIKGQDGAQQLSSIHVSFELPPPAIHDASRISPTKSKHTSPAPTAPYPATLTSSSPRTIYPLQAAEAVKSRRRSSAAKDAKDESSFTLPPPPTRSRKIIQMKPRAQEEAATEVSTKDSGKAGGKGATGAARTAAIKNNATADAGGAQGKKRQPSATSAAGRKIARKTAHSLIERRRRSKMNEEFAVLKSMIPACTGEMHKLAILQASIDYVRYLEDCVAKLKAQHGEKSREQAARNPLPSIRDFHPTFHADPSGDVDMSDSDTASPLFAAQPDHAHPPISPALQPDDVRHRQQSYSSVSTDQRHYSFSTSAGGASPAFGPQRHGVYSQSSASGSTLTSPALNPQSDLDQEASAALLMLTNDRRGTNPALNARGLSVRDLLST